MAECTIISLYQGNIVCGVNYANYQENYYFMTHGHTGYVELGNQTSSRFVKSRYNFHLPVMSILLCQYQAEITNVGAIVIIIPNS